MLNLLLPLVIELGKPIVMYILSLPHALFFMNVRFFWQFIMNASFFFLAFFYL